MKLIMQDLSVTLEEKFEIREEVVEKEYIKNGKLVGNQEQ